MWEKEMPQKQPFRMIESFGPGLEHQTQQSFYCYAGAGFFWLPISFGWSQAVLVQLLEWPNYYRAAPLPDKTSSSLAHKVFHTTPQCVNITVEALVYVNIFAFDDSLKQSENPP